MASQGPGHDLFDKSIGHFNGTFSGTMMSPAATSPLDGLACRLFLSSNSAYGSKGALLLRGCKMVIHTMKTRFAEDVPIAVVSEPNNIEACLIGGTGYTRRAPGVR